MTDQEEDMKSQRNDGEKDVVKKNLPTIVSTAMSDEEAETPSSSPLGTPSPHTDGGGGGRINDNKGRRHHHHHHRQRGHHVRYNSEPPVEFTRTFFAGVNNNSNDNNNGGGCGGGSGGGCGGGDDCNSNTTSSSSSSSSSTTNRRQQLANCQHLSMTNLNVTGGGGNNNNRSSSCRGGNTTTAGQFGRGDSTTPYSSAAAAAFPGRGGGIFPLQYSPTALAQFQASWATNNDGNNDFFQGNNNMVAAPPPPSVLTTTDRGVSTASASSLSLSSAANIISSSTDHHKISSCYPDLTLPISRVGSTLSAASSATNTAAAAVAACSPAAGGGGGGLLGPTSTTGVSQASSFAEDIGGGGSASISSAIHDAARITNWDQVLDLCRTQPQHAAYKGRDGWTALHHACNRRCPYANVVDALLEAFPDALIQPCEKGWLPLHYACRFKAPKSVVQLLLHKYPDKGLSTVSQADQIGRKPIFYAIRYDAPPGVVGLLLQVDPSAVLEEDQNDDSPLALVWDSWAEKLEGKRIVNSFLPGGFPEPDDNLTGEQRAKLLRERLARNSKLLKRWLKVNTLLKAAFGFPVEDDDEDEGNNNTTNVDDGSDRDEQEETEELAAVASSDRKWRIVHATAAVKCHLSLFLLACALHPEQVQELDEGDLQRPGDYQATLSHHQQTALHLAASSNAGGEPGKAVLLTILREHREAAQMPDGIDESLPLHRMVENTQKQDWSNHAAILYRFYPRAVQMADSNGQLPLHRAAKAVFTAEHQQHDPDESVIVQLARAFPQAAAHVDHSGCFPLHLIANYAESWDVGVESVYNLHRNALQVRSGPDHHNRLPLHMAAASVYSGTSLLSRLIQHHPRATSLTDGQGKLPLHLACEIGKRWDDDVQTIYSAFPNAVHTREENDRGWLPLHMAVNAPNSDAELIAKLIELHPEAAAEPDSEGRYPLHLACNSGKSWLGGVEALFEADPAPLALADSQGFLPFHLATLRHCAATSDNFPSLEDKIEDCSPKLREAKRAAEAAKVDIFFNLLRADPTVLAATNATGEE